MRSIPTRFVQILMMCLLLALSHGAFAQALKKIPEGTVLSAGDAVYSGNQQYVLTMQTDGNLVFYRVADQHALWNSQTAGSGANHVVFAPLGVISIRNPAETELWNNRGGYIGAGYPGIEWHISNNGDLFALYYGSAIITWLARDPNH